VIISAYDNPDPIGISINNILIYYNHVYGLSINLLSSINFYFPISNKLPIYDDGSYKYINIGLFYIVSTLQPS